MTKSKSSEFLKCFWDLASDESSIRIAASDSIILHVVNSSATSYEDLDYALKRLVKGLSSSRASARLGFSACLTHLLTIPSLSNHIDIQYLMNLSDENTKSSNSMKGMDERDVIFGKLFFYLSIIKSHRINESSAPVSSSTIDASILFERILEIFHKRGWLKEVAVESILLLINASSSFPIFLKNTFTQLSPLISDPIYDLTAWQITLIIGLSHIADSPSSELNLLIYPEEHLEAISSTLLASTNGFPKMHRVWDSILGLIFGFDQERALPSTRSVNLSPSQERLLLSLCGFMSSSLLSASHEKKGVALRLTILLLRSAPPHLFPHIISRSIVRLVLAARGNKKHTLHEYAFGVCNEWIQSAALLGDSSSSRLALASVLVQFGGANFDSLTGSSALQSLLHGLNKDALLEHVKFLCNIISHTDKVDNESAADDEAKGSSDRSKDSALIALALLARNCKPSFRPFIASVIVGVLVRLSCFTGLGATGEVSRKKSRRLSSVRGLLSDDVISATADCVALLSADVVAEDVVASASYRIVSLLSDIGTAAIADKGDEAVAKGLNYLDVAFAWMCHFSTELSLIRSQAPAASQDEDNDDQIISAKKLLKKAAALYASTTADTLSGAHGRAFDSIRHFLVITVIHIFSGEEVALEVLADACDVLPRVIDLIQTSIKDSAGSVRKPVLDEDASLLVLYDVSVELVCGGDERPVKGLREATKKLWQELCSYIAITKDLLDQAVGRVVKGFADSSSAEDDDGESEEEEAGSDDGDDIEEEDKDSNRMDEVIDDTTENEDGSAKENSTDEDEQEGDDEFLLGHNSSADAALAEMIAMRKQSRKQSAVESQRRELMINTRCVDFVEIMLRHTDAADIVIPQILPIFTALKSVSSSSSISSSTEAKGFESKVRAVVETRLLKSKLRFRNALSGDSELAAMVGATADCLLTLLRSPTPALRQLSVGTLLALTKAVIADGEASLIHKLSSSTGALLSEYLSKKNSNINSKLFDEFTLRLADFSVPSIVSAAVDSLDGGRTSFLLTEAHRIYSSCLKRYSSLNSNNKRVILDSLNSAVLACTNLLRRNDQGADKSAILMKDLKTKHRLLILNTCKDISQIVSSNKESIASSDILINFTEAVKPLGKEGSLKSLVDQICRLLGNPPTSAIDSSGKASSSNLKRKEDSAVEGREDTKKPKKKQIRKETSLGA